MKYCPYEKYIDGETVPNIPKFYTFPRFGSNYMSKKYSDTHDIENSLISITRYLFISLTSKILSFPISMGDS